MPARRLKLTLTTGSLGGLLVGLAAGALLHGSGSPAVEAFASGVEPMGTLWVNALRMTIIPLVVSTLIAAVTAGEGTRDLGWLGAGALLIFVVLLLVAGAFTLAVVPPVLRVLPVSSVVAPEAAAPAPIDLGSLGGGMDATAPAPEEATTFLDWLAGLVPANPVTAAAEDDFLPLIVFTLLFALAIARTASEQRRALASFFRAVSEAMLLLVRWILVFTPLGVFALAFSMTLTTGFQGATALGYYVILLSGLLLAFTFALYPVGSVGGGVPVRRFARALVKPQAVAFSTRSSLASLPALMEGATADLRLSPAVSGFVLPLSVSTFKAHRTISDPLELLFLAHLYGITLDASQIATFFVTILVLSFSAVGIPSGGYSFKTLPAFLAVGIPLEGVVILKAVDVIPDLFKTLLNVTADMTAATVVARFVAGGTERAPDLAPEGSSLATGPGS